MRQSISAAVLLILCALSLSAAKPGNPEIAVTLGNGEVQLNNVAAKGVLLFGATLRQEMSVPTLRRFSEILDDPDRDHVVSYKPRGGTPLRGIWVAIDLETGSLAIAGRQDYTLIRLPFPHGSAKRDAEGLIEALEEERIEMDLVLVRPGVGAWILHARDGSRSDGDAQANGRLRLVFENAQPLTGTSEKAPKHIKKGDVVAAIDIGRMEVFATALEN